MSLENHIEWTRNIDSVHKSILVQEKIRKIFWRSVPCLWEDFSIVETKETVYIQPIYDFSGVSPDERQELDETAWRNMKIISTALESDDMHSPLNLIRASDWIDKYRIWTSIRLPNTKYQEGVIDIWGNLIPHPEYIWPFCDILTRTTVTSILDAYDLRPESISKSSWDAREVWNRIQELKWRMQKEQLGICNLAYTPSFHNADMDYLQDLEERMGTIENGISEEKQDIIFRWKMRILVTPESYISACDTLWIEQWAPYAQCHKAYMRHLARYHPDKITREVLRLLPPKPEKLMVAQWEAEFKKKKWQLGEVYATNRNTLLEAWEIIQSYQGMPWEQSKDIDITYSEVSWDDGNHTLYNAIRLDRSDVIVANAFLEKRWGLWYDRFWKYNDTHGIMGIGDETLFKRVWDSFTTENRPRWLVELAKLLESRTYEPEKIQTKAKQLKSSIPKPSNPNDPNDINFLFHILLEGIVKNPKRHSESFKEYQFQPTLRFGKWYTWRHGIAPQDFSLPLWLIFWHIYLNTTGVIPVRLGEKFVKKYLPESSIHEVVQILESIQDKIPGESIVHPWKNPYKVQKQEIFKKYNLADDLSDNDTILNDELDRKIVQCERLAKYIDDMCMWLTVYLINDDYTHDEYSQIGVEVTPDGWIHIYYPRMTHRSGAEICSLYLSPKDVATLYLAMLESPILDSMDEAKNRLTHEQ